MKKLKLTKVVLILSILTTVMSLFGCSNHISENENVSTLAATNTFTKMSQEERKSYIASALKNKYGLDCEIDEAEKRQISVFSSEKDYLAMAQIVNDKFSFSNWISDNGEIDDTAFCVDILDNVNQLVSDKMENYWNEFYICDNFYFYYPSSKRWTSDDDMNKMLTQEKIVNRIYLFLNTSNNRDDDKAKFEKIKSDFPNYQGMIFIYYCDNPNEINVNNYDTRSFENTIELTREGFYE